MTPPTDRRSANAVKKLSKGMASSSRSRPASWSEAQAEAHLRSLELFGMRFGLDRMRRMMTVLGSPQRRFPSIHVVGTNGKTSTTRMVAAILQRHGLSTAIYTSPHLISYRERLQIGERGVQVAAIEAGLGGRYDATAVIESRVTALTNVGLEHTRWLGPTLRDIAEEKLAVVRPGTTLVLGADLAPEALTVAERVAHE